MVPATPSGVLAKEYQQVVDSNPGPVKIKFMEEGGKTAKSMVQNTNPTKTKGCIAPDCLACKHGRGKGGECHRNNVGYNLTCDLCGGDNVCYVGGKLDKMSTQEV